jgi:hypothetical protein
MKFLAFLGFFLGFDFALISPRTEHTKPNFRKTRRWHCENECECYPRFNTKARILFSRYLLRFFPLNLFIIFT